MTKVNLVRRLRRRARDERGATLVLVGMCMVLLLWGGAYGVDLGITVVNGRSTQAIADTSALDLARYIGIADWPPYSTKTASLTYLNGKLANVATDNNSNATLSETGGLLLNGVFTPQGGSVIISGRSTTVQCWYFTPPATSPCNAVKVTATQSNPQIFAGGRATVTRTAVAAVTPEASFSLGSYLASMDSQQSTVLSALLGQLGGAANVTTVGFEGLATTNVTLRQLITASGGLLTPSNILTASLTPEEWQGVWNDAVANQVSLLNCSSTPTPPPCSASTALSGTDALTFNQSSQAELCQLVSINGSSCGGGNLSTAALSTSLNALQTFTTEAQVADNDTTVLDLGTALGITGVTDAKLTLSLGQIPQVAFGPVGTAASTAQVSSDLQLSLLSLPGQILDIPLSAAQGTASLTTLKCSDNSMVTTSIQPASTTATGTVTLGGVTVSPVSVTGYSGTVLGWNSTDVPITPTTVSNGTNPQTAGQTDPQLNYSGLSTSSPVYALLSSTLQGVVGPILQAAGVTVGGLQVADFGTNCGAVSLVQ